MQSLVIFYALRSLNLSVNQISSLGTSLQFNENLREVNLSHNRLEDIEGLQHLQNLKRLDVSCNRISDIKCIGGLKRLEDLQISHNKLRVLVGIDQLHKLARLNASHNHIKDAAHLSFCGEIQCLNLSHNALEDIEEIRDLLMCLDELFQVSLQENPLCKHSSYNLYCIENRSVKFLDNIEITAELRTVIEKRSQAMRIEEMVEIMSEEYMKEIEFERELKESYLLRLKQREDEVEKAYTQYRHKMDQDLDECVRYMQDFKTGKHHTRTYFFFRRGAYGMETSRKECRKA